MITNAIKPFSFIIFLAFSAGANSASFDCQKAKSINEKLICEDDELSKLDDELSVIYKSALAKSEAPKDLIANQRTAWKQREAECSSKSCLFDWFTQRKAFFAGANVNNAKTLTNNTPGLPKEKIVDSSTQSQKITEEQKAINLDESRRKYIDMLHSKYQKNIIPASVQAFQIIADFSIDCRSQDRRYLPLIHVLYAIAAEYEKMGGKAEFLIENRGKQVRIYERVYGRDGRQMLEPKLKFEINEWNELRSFGILLTAVRNSCFGSYGPIWEIP